MARTLQTLCLLLFSSSHVHGVAVEHFGNEPLRWDPNSPATAVINDQHRVYHKSEPGSQNFYFQGDARALNAALENYARLEAVQRVVVLRPGPGIAFSFRREKKIEYSWRLQLAGVFADVTVQDEHFYMHIYIGDDFAFHELAIPAGVTVMEIADLQARYEALFNSDDPNVRGTICYRIAKLNPYDLESMRKIATLLQDEDDWVKNCAVSALSLFDAYPDEVIAALRAVETDDEPLQERIKTTIASLETAQPGTSPVQHTKILKAIQAYIREQKR